MIPMRKSEMLGAGHGRLRSLPQADECPVSLHALFKPERVADEEAFNRFATLEFLCQRYGVREP